MTTTSQNWTPQLNQTYLMKSQNVHLTVDRIEGDRVFYHSDKEIKGTKSGDMLISDFVQQCNPQSLSSEKAAG